MTDAVCRVLVTGANGFIGKNLVVRLRELPRFAVVEFVRGDDVTALPQLLAQADIDGGLIGGASLKASDFAAIARAA